jgi:DNA polymerase III subunit beta
MLFTISSNDLYKALARLKPATNNRELEILKSVLVEVKQGEIELFAFNLSQGISTRIKAEVESPEGVIAIPYAMLSSLTANLEGEIRMMTESSLLHIQSNLSRFKIALPDAEKFPALPIETILTTEFDFAAASTLFRDCIEVAADDLSKQVLTGVCITPTLNGLEMAATDSHRLLVRNSPSVTMGNSQIVLPADLLEAVLITFKDEESLWFATQGNLVKFESATTSLIGRVLEGNYPKYASLIPTSFQQEIVVDTQQLKTAIKIVNPLSSNKTVKLGIKEGALQVYCNSEIGEATTEISIEGYEQDLEIAFDVDYLLGALKPLTGQATLKLSSWNSPMLVCSENYTHLVMPTQVTRNS